MSCKHEWGPWGLPKPNDEGMLLSYRRCRACQRLESANAMVWAPLAYQNLRLKLQQPQVPPRRWWSAVSRLWF